MTAVIILGILLVLFLFACAVGAFIRAGSGDKP